MVLPAPSLSGMTRTLVSLLAVALLLAGCSQGPAAPPVGTPATVCTEGFCLDVPEGWGDEVGDTYIAFHHDVLPDGTFLTANLVDMEAIVESAGGTWPVPTEEVVTAFWSLLEDVDEGELARTERQLGGAIRSWGVHSTGQMWHLLYPVDGTVAIGVEMRGPNDSWETHADAVFPTVTPNTGS